MSKAASAILWPGRACAGHRDRQQVGMDVLYAGVRVPGPSVSTTVHRSESLRGTRASLTRDPEAEAIEQDYRDPTSR